jgi:NADPH:quinone reductase-like Zn-dependent oxidoreductase
MLIIIKVLTFWITNIIIDANPRRGMTRPMKAFVLERYGKQSTLQPVEMATPDPREDEVLVEVHAAGVNLLDSKIRDGEFKLILPYRLPLVLGHDVAGVVVKVGAQVRLFKPGDEVYARVDDFRIGTFAHFVPVKESSLALKPGNLTMEEAASIPLVGLTAWQALVEKAALKRGQKVFIQAGSVGQAPRRDGRHDDRHGQCRAREGPRGRRRHRLQEAGLRRRPA